MPSFIFCCSLWLWHMSTAITTDSRRDAALLAGVGKATAEAYREFRRRRTVRVGPDGAVREPASGA